MQLAEHLPHCLGKDGSVEFEWKRLEMKKRKEMFILFGFSGFIRTKHRHKKGKQYHGIKKQITRMNILWSWKEFQPGVPQSKHQEQINTAQ